MEVAKSLLHVHLIVVPQRYIIHWLLWVQYIPGTSVVLVFLICVNISEIYKLSSRDFKPLVHFHIALYLCRRVIKGSKIGLQVS